jgi:hypothetical protein
MRIGARRSLRDRTAALLLACALAPVASAQVRTDDLSSPVLRAPGLRGTASPAPTEGETPGPPASFADTTLRSAGWLGNSVRLEVPRDVVTGHYARPKLVVGLPSASMKNWMNSAGLDADHCMLPMLRARTRMTTEGDIQGTLWLYARCTFR